MIILLKKKTGNNCFQCHNGILENGELHKYTVYVKDEGEKRGHNYPVCSEKCGEKYIKKIKN